jgi:uncharacterized membrane protein (UPF0127 family)
MHIKIDKVCSSALSQARGLMFSKPKTLLFMFQKERRIAIHTCFVCFPITLVFLDRNKQVTETATMDPWRTYRSKNQAKWLIEIPYKTKEFSVGQKIEIN